MIERIRQAFFIGHSGHQVLTSMEGIRGFAVFLVFCVHFCAVMLDEVGMQPGLFHTLATWLKNIGSSGVDLFFVLSGYLIYGILIRRHRHLPSYFRDRIRRIYPAYIAVFLIYLAASWVKPDFSKIPTDTSDALVFLTHSFLLLPPVFSDLPPLITVAWTLSYELSFYLLIPLAITLFSMRRWTVGARIGLLLATAVTGYIYCFFYGGHVRMLMFVAGMLLYELQANRQAQIPKGLGLLCLLLAFAAMIGMFEYQLPHGGYIRNIVMFILFGAFCLEAFQPGTPAHRLFSIVPLRMFGNMSYSYYLLHGLTVKISFLLISTVLAVHNIDWLQFIGLLMLLFLLSLIPTTALYVMIERPFSLSAARRGNALLKTEAKPDA